MINFGVVGTGWRAEFFLRIATACPDKFRVVGIVGRNRQKANDVGHRFRTTVFDSLEDLVKQGKPDFVVLSLSRGATVPVIEQCARQNIPVLVETPPAETLDDLFQVWDLVNHGAKIQVAEQYWAQPHHAARLALVKRGYLGTVTQAQISVCHGYHGISLMRRFLDVTFENATITASGFSSPIVEGPGRNGPPKTATVVSSKQVTARFDFGDKLGIYDFTGDQYFSYIRGQRVMVRGDRGELVDEHAVYLKDSATPLHVSLARQSAGQNGNLEGNFLKGIEAGAEWLYVNPLRPAALSDEEVAIGTCLLAMSDYASGGKPFYSFAEAAQDRYLDLLMERALATQLAVQSQTQPWHVGLDR